MKNKDLLIYRIATVLLTVLYGFGAIMYFAQYDMVTEKFETLGFASFIVYPLAIAKLLGIVAIWTNKSESLKEFAYAGYVFVALLAAGAHLNAGDGDFFPPLLGLIFVLTSYKYNKRLKAKA